MAYSYSGSVRDLLEVEISAEGALGLQLKKRRLKTGLQTLAVSGLLKDSFGRSPAAAAVEALDGKVRNGLRKMLLHSINGEEYDGRSSAKEMQEQLVGPLHFALESQQHYDSRPHGKLKEWGKMEHEERDATILLG